MSESEAAQIRLGLESIDISPMEWGVYMERSRSDGQWAPSVAGGYESRELADRRLSEYRELSDSVPGYFRNFRIVRRVITPWELTDDE